MFFFPDRVVACDQHGYGVGQYSALQLELRRGTFVLGGESLPADAKVVDYTWRYVNKRGGPDRRFANNPHIANIAVTDVCIDSGSGLAGILKFSSSPAAEVLHTGITRFGAFVTNLKSSAVSIPPTAASTQRVYCWIEDKVTGPYVFSLLPDLEAKGAITRDSLVCREGETEWQFLDDLQQRGLA